MDTAPVRVLVDDQPGCSHDNAQKPAISKQVLSDNLSYDEITEVIDPSTSSETPKKRAATRETNPQQEGGTSNHTPLNEETPKRGIKRRHRPSAVRSCKAVIPSDGNYGITIIVTGDVEEECITFEVENSYKKGIVITKIRQLIDELDESLNVLGIRKINNEEQIQ
ncbi:uncharacterized protein LOC107041924 [Diachasma alloeum]|uniref:uncharacterized protein LOC107041924 n=1 Tax=Diachasma alloeum TaxID=454923 RepID=UPI0007382FFF|nr:uncharacterized protein LOC107041924 [Diachasma alloeum]